MYNVFDLVEDFYSQDEEWNSVLRQSYVENFLRLKSWQGSDNDALIKYWDYITMLCLYLGNTENFLGDMSRDDFIDCLAWCARNISEFQVTDKSAAEFLDVMGELYVHLQSKKIITAADAPALAKAKLLPEGKLTMMDKDGVFYPEYSKYNLYASPDLPAKIFLNIGERLQGLFETMQKFFRAPKFRKDVERAAFLYSGILLSGAVNEKPGSDEYMQCFWDYFFFDYYMLEQDIRPLEYFYKFVLKNGLQGESRISTDMIEELLKAKLVLFSVSGINEEGLYICRDFLTGDIYNLILPVDENTDIDKFLFLGHIFYNESMVMSFVRGMTVAKSVRKKLFKAISLAKDWVALRSGGELSWQDFTSRYTMFVRHVSLIYSAFVRLEDFNYTTAVADYTAQPIDNDDRTTQLIEFMMKPYAFSAQDIRLAQTMWSDYKAVNNKKARLAELWAAGIIKCFIEVNGVYNYDLPKISEMCHNIPVEPIVQASEKIKETLRLEAHDPRYINEEGLLLMLLS